MVGVAHFSSPGHRPRWPVYGMSWSTWVWPGDERSLGRRGRVHLPQTPSQCPPARLSRLGWDLLKISRWTPLFKKQQWLHREKFISWVQSQPGPGLAPAGPQEVVISSGQSPRSRTPRRGRSPAAGGRAVCLSQTDELISPGLTLPEHRALFAAPVPNQSLIHTV